MCGIAGYFGAGDRATVQRMIDQIAYRGPDGQGIFTDDRVGLGHARLAIIDLDAAANQPLGNEEGSIQIVFNGEIYNFSELRRELEGRHVFRSRSDTETIVHLYEELGDRVFERLNGMFAIAIYDARRRRLLLARDRLGKKPLYWARRGATLVFGSELKALWCHPSVPNELDLRALNQYLQLDYVPTPYSISRDVAKLEPGHCLTFDGQELSKRRFWEVSFERRGQAPSLEEATAELDRRLRQAVKTRLISDVPLGIFLSGGLDSGAIAYYAQSESAAPIKTFSIGFDDPSFDESPYARRLAADLGTEHHEKIFRAADLLAVLPEVGQRLDEPLADPSLLPTYLLSRFARERVTVALGGDGGDELFFGYDTFLGARLAAVYDRLPRLVKKNLIEPLVARLPTSFDNISFDFKIKQFLKGCAEEKKYRHHLWLGAFDQSERARLLAPEVWAAVRDENPFAAIDLYLQQLAGEGEYEQLAYLYLRTYLQDDILVKVDRASMFNALEVRAPFLDYTLVDFVTALPLNYKLRGWHRKVILKRLLSDKLPAAIVQRKKKGFGIPVAKWLADELKELTLDLLSADRLRTQGLFSPSYVETLIREHFERKKDNRKLLWNLLVFQIWRQHYGR